MMVPATCFRIQTQSPRETARLGETIGRRVFPGLIIALTGEPGSGKTAFTQGLARGLGVDERHYVTSPSYTLINQYPGKRLTLYHIDLYRLFDAAEVLELGLEEILNQPAVAAIEWADKFGHQMWQEDLKVALAISGVMTRDIDLTARNERARGLIKSLS
ncbi:MAG: tRNA (adenosine(37)-N6)-threonylcarbamoyltransferase complex ATPase subunit type 1 TsaE [Desulfosudaceae bacterium]